MNVQVTRNPFAIIKEQRLSGNAELKFIKQQWPLYSCALNDVGMVQVLEIKDALGEWSMQIGMIVDEFGSHGNKLQFVFVQPGVTEEKRGYLLTQKPVDKLRSYDVEKLAEYLIFESAAEKRVYELEARGIVVSCTDDFK